MMKTIFSIILLMVSFGAAFGQKQKLETKRGNDAYQQGDFEKATQEYTSALEADDSFKEARFNLGNALQRKADRMLQAASETQDPQEKEALTKQAKDLNALAVDNYQHIASTADSPEEKNKVNYNMGNAFFKAGELEKSIEAYKEALRSNPNDDDARYNLAMAKRIKEQQQQQQQDQDQQENQDQQQQEQQDQDQQNQDQNQKDQNQNQEENQDQQQQQQPQDQLSKEDAQKMLDALNQEEEELQEEIKKQRNKAQPIKIEKDW